MGALGWAAPGSGQTAIADQPAANFGQSRVYFNAMRQMNRPAVTLIGGSLYLAYASHGDDGPYYGWMLGFDANTFAPTGVLQRAIGCGPELSNKAAGGAFVPDGASTVWNPLSRAAVF